MIDADFSQIEYRTLVALAHEQHLIDKFTDPDMDYHTTMASLMYGVPYALVTPKMRSDAKSFNFGIPYGMGFASLAKLLTGNSSKKSIEEAKEKYELYFKDQPNVRQFFVDVKARAKYNEYTETLWHRVRKYKFTDKDGKYSQKLEAQALRQAGNAVIQGCLDGDTLIQTKEFGVVKIKDVEGYSGPIWNGTEWTRGDVLYSGQKQKCIITFENEQKFICSPIHKFLIAGKDAKESSNYIECQNLTPGVLVEYNTNTELKVENYDTVVNTGLAVKSVEITDEWIDMYDVCNTDCGYYVADGIVTHNTAADIFKIAAARTFLFIRQNNLFGKFYVTNMVHDEQLTEVDVSVLNAKVVLKNLVECMELHLDGFPPLYVGAGVGDAWAHAKGKMAEIHPLLAEQFIEEAKKEKLFLDKPQTPAEVLKYFDDRVFEFRKKKVMDYIMDKKNWGQPVYPVVGNLLSLQFDNGVTAEFESKYTEKNGYTKEQIAEAMKGIVPEQIKRFIEQYNLDVDWKNFAQTSDNKAEDEEEDVEYDDAEEFDEDGVPIEPEDDSVFELLDEDDKVFGIDYRDIIAEYGIIVSPKLKICGVKVSNLSARVKDDFANYLGEHLCDKDDPNSMQVVYLKDNNTLLNTNVYVRGVLSSQLSKILGIKY